MTTQRRLLENGRAEDGLPLRAGEQFLTGSDRLTTRFPSQKSEKFYSAWLIENACAEALARRDHFAHLLFSAERFSKSGELPAASVEHMTLYTFGKPSHLVPRKLIRP